MSEYHNPVMLRECLTALITNTSGIYADATFGGGGQSRGIMEAIGPDGRIIAFDRDADAMSNAIDDEKRYKETEILYHQYSSYQMDSALHYAHKLISIARKMNSDLNTQRAKFLLASTYINFGMYNEAQEIVNATNRSTIDADEELRANYYYVNNTLYDAMQHFVRHP